MSRKRFFLFKYADNPLHTRIGVGSTVQEACRDAFGCVYGPTNNVKYKDIGTRSPVYLSQKVKQEFYKPRGRLDIPLQRNNTDV